MFNNKSSCHLNRQNHLIKAQSEIKIGDGKMFSYVASHEGIIVMVFLFMRTINDRGGSLKCCKEDKIYYPIHSSPLRVKAGSREGRIYFTTT